MAFDMAGCWKDVKTALDTHCDGDQQGQYCDTHACPINSHPGLVEVGGWGEAKRGVQHGQGSVHR